MYAPCACVSVCADLAVPLPYRILYGSSRSKICDQSSADHPEYCLWREKNDEKKLEVGVILLKRNTEFLLHSRVPEWSSHQARSASALENLLVFANYEVDMRLPRRR